MLYHIVDENKKIIDSSENSLELRLDCAKMNARLGGKCKVVSDGELKRICLNEGCKIKTGTLNEVMKNTQ